jgi:response regulator RpfG family c-di-GMP phosphodiesterase
MTHKLLIVDDEAANLRLLERLFSKDFQCLTASSGAEAIRLLEQHDVAILVTDQRMPEMTGIELLKRTARLRPHMVRILLTGYTDMEALVEALNSGLVYMYITKPWNNEELKLRVNRAGEHYQTNKNRQALADGNQRLLLRMEQIKLAIVTALSEMLKIRDKHAAAHVLRVRDHAIMIATKLGVSEEQKQDLSMASMLHHLGGIENFPRSLSSRPASPTEQTILQEQSECAARLLHSIPELAGVLEIVNTYRENFDGSGSPRGLRGEQIPPLCRILRLADEYDQMVLPKASAPMIHDEAMRFLIQRSGKQFDPRVIEVLSQLTPQERGQDRDPATTHYEHNRVTQDTFEPAYVDAVFS